MPLEAPGCRESAGGETLEAALFPSSQSGGLASALPGALSIKALCTAFVELARLHIHGDTCSRPGAGSLIRAGLCEPRFAKSFLHERSDSAAPEAHLCLLLSGHPV